MIIGIYLIHNTNQHQHPADHSNPKIVFYSTNGTRLSDYRDLYDSFIYPTNHSNPKIVFYSTSGIFILNVEPFFSSLITLMLP